MPADVEQLRRCLQAFDLSRLLVEELGWNHYHARPVSVQVDGTTYTLEPTAEKAGFVVYVCGPDPNGGIPPYPIRRKIERQAARVAFEHMIIFVDGPRTMQVWQWVKREGGKPAACREQEYRKGQRGDALIQRLQRVAFELEEEEGLNIPVVALRVQQALDAEKVTKQFYDRFKKEMETFRSFIQGIAVQGDKEWYASLMLNRMMFVYFIQKQGFLDGDLDYLRNRMNRLQAQSGKGRFQQFYRLFLLRLFHEGLGQPEASRAPDLAELLGRVPYLNGGLFDVHDLERNNPDTQIPDEAFEKVFDFFDAYRWHLDERPHRADNEINPDVLGYIFEKYVNQKQMGAYYTKEDITGYIARNTIIPFLFDAARKECPVAFGADGGVWRLLKDNPDRYIYPAVGHGIAWDARQTPPCPLERPFELPGEIGAGIDDVSQRGGWNRPAPEEYALPTETWREVVARRQRHHEVRAKLTAGDVQNINDLITLNLDICRFAEDVIVQSEGPELIRAFWHALRDVSILDPACGSGAFLFAALNILEPLYTACLEGMQGFLDDLQRSERPHHPEALRDFRNVLEEVGRHPNRRYYVLKSIVVNNLYGVDIMEEAVEICKLRLFLKLVAQVESYEQIEPLPDVDFNIRAGNTLVGFTSLDAVREAMTTTRDRAGNVQVRMLTEQEQATLQRIEEDAQIADDTFVMFQLMQTEHGMPSGDFAQAKVDLRRRLDSLRDQLDRYLAAEYGIDLNNAAAYEGWRISHQPFHWFVEFYGIMHRGGFDVIIGNPPYVELRLITEYSVRHFATIPCGNLYTLCVERASELLGRDGSFGMIVPLSGFSTDRVSLYQEHLSSTYSRLFLSFYSGDAHPSVMFNGVKYRLSIVIGRKQTPRQQEVYTTGYKRWYATERDHLFPLLAYAVNPFNVGYLRFARLGNSPARAITQKLTSQRTLLAQYISARGAASINYHRSPVFWIRSMDFEPYFNSASKQRSTDHLKDLFVAEVQIGKKVAAVLNSTCFYFWFITQGNCRNVAGSDINSFPVGDICGESLQELQDLFDRLMKDFRSNSKRRVYNYRYSGRVEYEEFYPNLSKRIIDEIDRVLAKHYGFTDEELDFIINYDIKYRMGLDSSEEDND